MQSPIKPVRGTACVLISKIAAIEIPRGGWKDLIQQLVTNITGAGDNVNLRQASFECLGYVCEEVRLRSCLLLLLVAFRLFVIVRVRAHVCAESLFRN